MTPRPALCKEQALNRFLFIPRSMCSSKMRFALKKKSFTLSACFIEAREKDA